MKRLFTLMLISIGLCACNGDGLPCYDESLVHNEPCTRDCPGFEGCDGKTYCNECVAAKLGIGPK